MSVVQLERLSSDQPVFRVNGEACSGCAGCGIRVQNIKLPHLTGRRASIEMSAADQWRMLVNSWLKPLAMLVAASVVCSIFPAAPMVEGLFLVAAFMTGALLCRKVPAEALVCTEEV